MAARNINAKQYEELMQDLDFVLSLLPGKKKLNLHACYAIFDDENGGWVDRDKIEPKHFKKWVDFCKERGLGCDFNPTFFSHPMCDPLTLSSPNEETRKFWIEHGIVCRKIAGEIGKRAAKYNMKLLVIIPNSGMLNGFLTEETKKYLEDIGYKCK